MSRVFNFSAGPAVLPEEVLLEVQKELLDYQGSGMSVMEMSHRSKPFEKILNDAIQDLKDLMSKKESQSYKKDIDTLLENDIDPCEFCEYSQIVYDIENLLKCRESEKE